MSSRIDPYQSISPKEWPVNGVSRGGRHPRSVVCITETLPAWQHSDAPPCLCGPRPPIAARPVRTSYSGSRRPLEGLACRFCLSSAKGAAPRSKAWIGERSRMCCADGWPEVALKDGPRRCRSRSVQQGETLATSSFCLSTPAPTIEHRCPLSFDGTPRLRVSDPQHCLRAEHHLAASKIAADLARCRQGRSSHTRYPAGRCLTGC